MINEFLDVDVQWVAAYNSPKGAKVKFHNHDYLQFVYVERGIFHIRTDTFEGDISDNSLMFFYPWQMHEFESIEDSIIIDIKFYMPSLKYKDVISLMPETISFNDKCYSEMFKEIISEAREKSFFSNTLINLKMLEIIYKVSREHSECRISREEYKNRVNINIEKNANIISDMVDYIECHYMEDITLKRLSGIFNYHPNYICEIFKEVKGITPIQYLIRYRLECAKRAMLFTEVPIKSIAESYGFSSISHFSKNFKKTEGVYPSEFRKKYANTKNTEIYINKNFKPVYYPPKIITLYKLDERLSVKI